MLLAYAMNGEPLPVQHGYPLRLIVPGWYAVASVKWLTEIEVIDRRIRRALPDRQVSATNGEQDGAVVREPVTLQRVRALITEPISDQEVRARRPRHPRRGLVRRGADRASGGEHRRRKLAGGPSRQRAQASQLAMVGACHTRSGPGR